MEQNDSNEARQPEANEQSHYRVRKPYPNRKKRLIVIVTLLLLLSAMGILSWFGYGQYKHSKVTALVPQSIRQSVDFSIYIPELSKTKVDKLSFDYSEGVLQFTADDSGTQLHFAEQKRTPEFDIDKFAGGIQITGVKQLTIPQGQVVIGSIQGKVIAFMDTGNTIVTLTGSPSSGSAETAMRSLQKL